MGGLLPVPGQVQRRGAGERSPLAPLRLLTPKGKTAFASQRPLEGPPLKMPQRERLEALVQLISGGLYGGIPESCEVSPPPFALPSQGLGPGRNGCGCRA